MVSMTSLEKSIASMVKKLEELGVACEVDVFNDTTKGGYYGGSGVTITLTYNDEWCEFEFKPKYGANRGKCISGFSKWSEAKTQFKSLVKKELPMLDINSL